LIPSEYHLSGLVWWSRRYYYVTGVAASLRSALSVWKYFVISSVPFLLGSFLYNAPCLVWFGLVWFGLVWFDLVL
jgi:hypothetical protein